MTELVSKVTQLRKLAPNLATVIEGKGSIDSAVGIQALAEKLEVEKDPTKISEKMEAVSLLNLIPILQAAEGLITSILPVDPEPVTPSVPDKKEEEQKSPIDEKFGLTGYKTLIGLGVCVLVWILQTLGVVDPTIATVGWGVGVFIGGAGAKAWLDRLGISLSKKSVQ